MPWFKTGSRQPRKLKDSIFILHFLSCCTEQKTVMIMSTAGNLNFIYTGGKTKVELRRGITN